MFAARALAAIVLTAGTVTPIACAPSAHVATPPSVANRVAVAGASGGNRSIATHNGFGGGLRFTPSRPEDLRP
ncbi:lysozyme family protein [Streptomyces erythrochromogenes]|uniref:hypothetical protein n=1 Tax=Streptomyces erythrochromogenes TaxID=285574 RepID=UPI0037FB2B73